MNDALKRFTPDSNWITAGLLTLLVVSFGIFAERHAGPHTQPAELTRTMCAAEETTSHSALSFVRYH